MLPVLLGLDVGTSGSRAIALDPEGNPLARVRLDADFWVKPSAAGFLEQDPLLWWKALREVVRSVLAQLASKGIPPRSIHALSLASTSGSVLALDRRGKPLAPAILYNDPRAKDEAVLVNQMASEHCERFGYRFGSSFALPKIVWIKRHWPEIYRESRWFLSPTDFLLGRLTGRFGRSDTSNMLKSGFDFFDFRWPDFFDSLGVDRSKFPEVLKTGQVIGETSGWAEKETGLKRGTAVVAGATDGTAALFSSGASRPGDFNATIGTSLVVKGVSVNLVKDPKGRLYCHYHPEGWWLPGGASNSGGDYLARNFSKDELANYEAGMEEIVSNPVFLYPLLRKGERFPFLNPEAEGFLEPPRAARENILAAGIEGLAFVERWCYEVIEGLGVPSGRTIYSSGAGAQNDLLSRVRASVLGKEIARAHLPETSMGAAIIAASGTLYHNISEAVAGMVRIERSFEPEERLRQRFDSKYRAWRTMCRRRGYE